MARRRGDIPFPALVASGGTPIEGVTWAGLATSPPGAAYDPQTPGTYAFTPTLPGGYALAQGVTPPVVTVTLLAEQTPGDPPPTEQPEGIAIHSIDPLAKGASRVTVAPGTPKQDIPFPVLTANEGAITRSEEHHV